ncbi:hypothetical protein [Robiginitalea sediminis]|uniref:hypothetical protein n=1 Tax=Robiginitalea sediminis TaxID=1982593 RepID=UPI000B4BA2C6|nr:hypothetical protein [Robiginitalea sediminis]
MMRLLWVLILGASVPLCGQSLSGTYTGAKDTLVFMRDSVCLRTLSNGGVSVDVAGMGAYAIDGNYLVIRTGSGQLPCHFPPTASLLYDETLVYLIDSPSGSHLELVLLGWVENSSYRGKRTIRRLMRDHRKYRYETRVLIRSNTKPNPKT